MSKTVYKQEAFRMRQEVPTENDLNFVNVNYGGKNRCISRNSKGWVLPNCTGYCWGRALETTKTFESSKLDLSINQASVWFSQNKTKFDNGTGGYPYIDFKNRTVNLTGVGGVTSIDSNNALVNLSQALIQPGNILCFDGGYSRTTEIEYDENGHVMTVENTREYENENFDTQHFFDTFGPIVTEITATWVTALIISPILAKALQSVANTVRYVEISKKIKAALTGYKYVEGWVISGTQKTVLFAIGNALYALIKTSAAIGTLAEVINQLDFTPFAFYEYYTSESSYNGNNPNSSIGVFNNSWISIRQEMLHANTGGASLQGAILVPPKLRTWKEKKSFPWYAIED